MTPPRIGIGLLLYNSRGEILLGKRKGDHGSGRYGPPGGHLENGESFADCAIRESMEETGIVVENPKFVALTNDIFPESGKHYVSIFLKAKCADNVEAQTLEPHKVESWKWYHHTELPLILFDPLGRYIGGDYEGQAFTDIFDKAA